MLVAVENHLPLKLKKFSILLYRWLNVVSFANLKSYTKEMGRRVFIILAREMQKTPRKSCERKLFSLPCYGSIGVCEVVRKKILDRF